MNLNPWGYGPTQTIQANTDSADAHDLACVLDDGNAEAPICAGCNRICRPYRYAKKEFCLACLNRLFPGRHVRHNDLSGAEYAGRHHPNWCACRFCEVAAIYGMIPLWRLRPAVFDAAADVPRNDPPFESGE